MRNPTPVRTRIMIAERGWSAKPQGIAVIAPPAPVGPIGIHVPSVVSKYLAPAARRDSSRTAPAETQSATRMTPQPITATAARLSRLPKSPLIATPKSGRTGINQISLSIASSPLQEVDLVHVGRAA